MNVWLAGLLVIVAWFAVCQQAEDKHQQRRFGHRVWCQSFSGSVGQGLGGTAAPMYSPDMYDDCRDAYGSISPAIARQFLAAADFAELGSWTDDDIRGLFKLACLMFASGAIPWEELAEWPR